MEFSVKFSERECGKYNEQIEFKVEITSEILTSKRQKLIHMVLRTKEQRCSDRELREWTYGLLVSEAFRSYYSWVTTGEVNPELTLTRCVAERGD